MKNDPEVDLGKLKSDILAGLGAQTLIRKYQMAEEALAKVVSALMESGDLNHEHLQHLYSTSEIIRTLTWQCNYCRKIVPAAHDTCPRCGNNRS